MTLTLAADGGQPTCGRPLRMIAYVRLVEVPPRYHYSSAQRREAILEQRYWLRRKREQYAMAWQATSAEAKLIHFDLAGRYSVKAAICGEASRQSPAR